MVVENNLTLESNRSMWHKVSWGAVFAAVVVVLATQLFFAALGLSFGAGAVDPLQEQNPFSGLGVGAAFWVTVTSLLSLFAGGWVAGRLSGAARKMEAGIHGLLGWAVATLATFYLLTTAVGSVVRGTTGVVGRVFSVVASGIGGVSSELSKQAVEAFQGSDLDLSEIKREAQRVLLQSKKAQLNPNTLERQGRQIVRDAGRTAAGAAQDPQSATAEIDALIDRVFGQISRTGEAIDKDAVINVLVARTDLTRAQATTTVDRWETAALHLRDKWQAAKAETEHKIRESGDQIARATSRAAVLAAFTMLLGAIAAVAGGIYGAPGWTLHERPL